MIKKSYCESVYSVVLRIAKLVFIDPSMGINLLLVVQFGQMRMFLKAYTFKLLFIYILGTESALRDSVFRWNARHKATALEMKSGSTLSI